MALEPKLTIMSLLLCNYLSSLCNTVLTNKVSPPQNQTYSTCSFIIFFMLMQFRIYGFKTQCGQSPRSVANARLAIEPPLPVVIRHYTE